MSSIPSAVETQLLETQEAIGRLNETFTRALNEAAAATIRLQARCEEAFKVWEVTRGVTSRDVDALMEAETRFRDIRLDRLNNQGRSTFTASQEYDAQRERDCAFNAILKAWTFHERTETRGHPPKASWAIHDSPQTPVEVPAPSTPEAPVPEVSPAVARFLAAEADLRAVRAGRGMGNESPAAWAAREFEALRARDEALNALGQPTAVSPSSPELLAAVGRFLHAEDLYAVNLEARVVNLEAKANYPEPLTTRTAKSLNAAVSDAYKKRVEALAALGAAYARSLRVYTDGDPQASTETPPAPPPAPEVHEARDPYPTPEEDAAADAPFAARDLIHLYGAFRMRGHGGPSFAPMIDLAAALIRRSQAPSGGDFAMWALSNADLASRRGGQRETLTLRDPKAAAQDHQAAKQDLRAEGERPEGAAHRAYYRAVDTLVRLLSAGEDSEADHAAALLSNITLDLGAFLPGTLILKLTTLYLGPPLAKAMEDNAKTLRDNAKTYRDTP